MPDYRLSVFLGVLKNKQVGICLGLECHLNFMSLLLLSGVHRVGNSDCAVGGTRPIISNIKFFTSRATDRNVGVGVVG